MGSALRPNAPVFVPSVEATTSPERSATGLTLRAKSRGKSRRHCRRGSNQTVLNSTMIQNRQRAGGGSCQKRGHKRNRHSRRPRQHSAKARDSDSRDGVSKTSQLEVDSPSLSLVRDVPQQEPLDPDFENFYHENEYTPVTVIEHFPTLADTIHHSTRSILGHPHQQFIIMKNSLQGAWVDTTQLMADLTQASLSRSAVATTANRKAKTPIGRGNLSLLQSLRRQRIQEVQKSTPITTYSTVASILASNTPTDSRGTMTTYPIDGGQHTRWDSSKWRNRLWELMENQPRPKEEKDSNVNSRTQQDADSIYQDADQQAEAHLPHITMPVVNSLGPILDEAYINDALPLHKAIRQSDENSLRALLRRQTHPSELFARRDDSGLDPFQLAVQLDNARILRILVMAVSSRLICEDPTNISNKHQWPPAPCLAATMGQLECLSVFLDASSSNLLSKDIRTGNTVLHLVCQKKVRSAFLSLCFDSLRGSASVSFTSKVLCQRNEQGESPLHVAASNGRADLVEMFLSFASLSNLSKILSIQDKMNQTPLLAAISSGSTDTVMSLLMWSGNNNTAISKMGSTAASPLLWAAASFHLDMVMLLLDFFHGAGDKTGLDQTLRHVLNLECVPKKRKAKKKIIQYLIQTGANACSEDDNTNLCALEIVAKRQEENMLRVVVESHDRYLKTLQASRRRDPVLQKQPESYFDGLEQLENRSFRVALRNSLLSCLVQSYNCKQDETSFVLENCAIFLYEKGAIIDGSGFHTLLITLKKISSEKFVHGAEQEYYLPRIVQQACPISTAHVLSGPYTDQADYSRHFWSMMARQSSWISSAESVHFGTETTADSLLFDVVLESEDGQAFEAHSVLLAKKSSKFDAAFRFHDFQVTCPGKSAMFPVPATASICKLLLQHMYHGSLVALPRDPTDCCDALLDLIVLADYLLCESLLQECEARLLSKNPWECHCCLCSVPVRIQGEQMTLVSSPSQLITPESALDVLATIDSLEFEASYRVLTREIESGMLQYRPLEKLRNVVALTCLHVMGEVFQSQAFTSQVQLCSGETEHFKHLLLRRCLEDAFTQTHPISTLPLAKECSLVKQEPVTPAGTDTTVTKL